MSLTVALGGEEVVLLAERALYWPRRSTLCVADPHLGKAASFRADGIFVPRGTTTSALERLERTLTDTGARRLLILGDLLHAREGRDPETLRVVGEWRAARPSLEVVLIRGNHDRRAGDPPASLGIACVDPPLIEEPFAFTHHPASIADRHVLSGHVHPGVRLSGRGRQSERLPCFWVRGTGTVLPAFGEFTGLGMIDPMPGDRVFATTGDAVVEAVVQGAEGVTR